MANTPPKGGGNLPVPLQYGGKVIHDRGEMVSLTDMWRAAKSPDAKRPTDWLALTSTIEFREAVEASFNAGKSGIETNRGGRAPGTWAHWQIGIAYAKYLSVEFHMWANTAVRDRMEEVRATGRLAAPIDPTDPATILQVMRHLQGQVEEGREAKAALDRLEASEGSRCVTDVAKMLKMQPIALRRELVARRWIYRRPGSDTWLAYRDKEQALLLEHTPHHFTGRDGTPRVRLRVMVTPKGMVRLAHLLGRDLINDGEES